VLALKRDRGLKFVGRSTVDSLDPTVSLFIRSILMPQTRTAVYTGSFDPITLGHLHIIQRASPLFDELVLGIGINADKKSLFEPQQRVELVRSVTGDLSNVRVEIFSGLAVDFVRSIGARVMVRGIRPLTDIAGEFTMMMANQQLDPDIETVFLMAAERYAHVSSSLMKQIAALSDDDEQLAKFVPREIIEPLRRKLGSAT
jgi:pantetheine-phosphate adenylyltransferase